MTDTSTALADAPAETKRKPRARGPGKVEEKQAQPAKAPPAKNYDEEVTRLAAMRPEEFEKVRRVEAEALSVRVAELTKSVEKARKATQKQENDHGQALAMLKGAVRVESDKQVMQYGTGQFEVSERDGVWLISIDPETGSRRRIWICSHLQIVAQTRDANSEAWGVLLRWRDPAGVRHQLALPAQMLQTDGADMRRTLADKGLRISPTQQARLNLQTYLQAWNPGRFARCVNRMGWFEDVFVLPGLDLDDREEIIVFQDVQAVETGYSIEGSAQDWRGSVARLAAGNSRLVFSISAAFAGALLEFDGGDSGGFHLRGASSTGKSTAQVAAASVWGHPGKYKRSWRFTANGLEGVAAMHNDGILILDELSECSPNEVGEAVYMLGNGKGKGRATRAGLARQAQSWRLIFLSSGEESLSTLMAKAGKRTNAGQEIRLVEIEADAGAGMGMFEQLNGVPTPAAFAQALQAAAVKHHGAAGMQWVCHLMQTRAGLGERVRAGVAKFVQACVKEKASGQVMRVARRFGLVAAAGELATAAGLTGWEAGAANRAAATCFRGWLDAFGGLGNREDRALLSQVRSYFETHGASRFEDLHATHDVRVPNRAGFYRQVDDGREYIVLPETFKRDVCSGFDSSTAAKVLAEAGWLRPGGNGRNTRTERLPGMGDKTRCYVFTKAMWEDASHDN